MRKILLATACLLFLFSGEAVAAGKVAVVTSIYPVSDIVRQVGGDRVEVGFMVPPGASPHTFEPKPSDMVKLDSARIFVMIGAGFEFWAEKAVKATGRRDLKVIVLSDGVPLLKGTDERGSGGHHNGEAADPHIWLDPLLVKEMAGRIAAALIELDPAGKAYYLERADKYRKELDGLHGLIAGSVANFRVKEYVTFHGAWNYFSKRYGLKVLGVIEESPGKEASPRHIAKIIGEIRRSGAKVVFAEPQLNPKTAEVIAREAGARVLMLDPIGGPGIRGRDTYIGLMRYNLSVLQDVMK